jgi:alpha-tubulin suppressor-like RCC1 family protein
MTNPILFRGMPAISNVKRKVWFREIKTFLLVLFLLPCTLATNSQCTYFSSVVSSAAGNHTLGIKSNGELWAWGWNLYGQLGDGTYVSKTSPVLIAGASTWVSAATGQLSSLAIKNDGTLWAWGNNDWGQLGDGTNLPRTTPYRISTDTWICISAGVIHTLGIKSDGTLWAWGYNAYGQVGDGTFTDRNIPVKISTATNWVSVAAGNLHSTALKSDGALWVWGSNTYGQLGDNTNTDKNIPTLLPSAVSWTTVSTGTYFTTAIKTDGTMWAWGLNDYGQLGNGTTINKNFPIQTGGILTSWKAVKAGLSHCIAIKDDGSLYGWGRNSEGQAGDGTFIDRKVPIRIGTETNWSVSISAGRTHSISINTNGTLFEYGDNSSGQIGDGTGLNRPSPVPIITEPIFTMAAANATATLRQTGLAFYHSSCNLITRVEQTGRNTDIKGTTTAKVWIEATQPSQFVKRHYEITPAANAATATAKVTLYFSQPEFMAFNAINSIKLPLYNSDVAKANLLIEKRGGVSSNGTGLPSTYTGTISTINPDDADIVWNSSLGRWEISFVTTGFSGFFLKTSPFVLPLRLVSFTGTKTNDANKLQWQTADEINTNEFIVERSHDGFSFVPVASVPAGDNNSNTYQYRDNYQNTGDVFYRLKMIDNDGRFTYSHIIILSDNNNNNTFSMYPNPAGNTLLIETNSALKITTVQIADINGRIVFKQQAGGSSKWIADISSLSPGIYIVSLCHDEKAISMKKLIKQ